ncbi:Diaminopimelate epimerase [Candidatus Vidania fulgoroideae]|nr:Diaminopimelate epimerase [Candidatus Vidania fulgoroideae]
MKIIKFIKINSYGNDFVISKNKRIKKKFLYNRNFGLGFDQLIIFKIKKNKKIIAKIYNSDLSEAYNCANGLRCLSFYILKKTKLKKINIYTVSRKHFFFFLKKNVVTEKLKKFNYNFLKSVVFDYKNMFFRNVKKSLQINFYLYRLYFQFIELGNFHIVFFIKKKKDIKKVLKKKSEFNNSNISFLEFKKNKIKTLENGVGFTLSCGSGTFASCISYSLCKPKKKKIFLKNKVGTLFFLNKKRKYYLTGKCLFLFYGKFFIKVHDNRSKEKKIRQRNLKKY